MKIGFFLSGSFEVPGPSNHLMEALMLDMLAAGHQVYMIGACFNPENSGAVPSDLLEYDAFTYELVPANQVDKSAFIKRYLEYVRFAFASRKSLKKACDCDILFSQSSPAAPFKIALARRAMRGKPVVYNVQDMFPGSSIASGVMTKQWMQRLAYALQKIAYTRSSHITVISYDMKQKLIQQGVDEEKITVIPNWYDDRSVHEILWEDNRFAKNYNLSRNKFYVQYAGTIGYVFDYEAFLYVASKLKIRSDIEFQIVGHGSQLESFKRRAEEKKLNNIVFYPLQDQDMVSDVYSACSVCLIPLKKNVIGNSVPSKASLLMACSRPIINSVDPDSYYFEEFNSEHIGISVSNNDYDALVSAVDRLYKDRSLLLFLGGKAYLYGKEKYARSTGTEKYLQLFSELTQKNPKGK